MEDKEFIAQLAQFNSLEQMLEVNKRLGEMLAAQQLSQASALIGKSVEARVPEGMGANGGDTLTGVVKAVMVQDGLPKLVVGTLALPLSAVLRVMQPAPPDAAAGTPSISGVSGTLL
jgi:flagellar basal-body rod modification protein FlgD